MSEAQIQSVATTLRESRVSGFPIWILVLSALVLGTYAAVSLLVPPGEKLTDFGDIVQCLVPLLAVTVLLWNASSCEWRKNLFWTMLATGCALWMFGQLMWTYLEVGLHQAVPNPFLGDVIYFLHIVPMFVALAMAPHAGKSDLNLRLSLLDSTFLLVWWLFLYMFAVIPWQYVAPNVDLYSQNFDQLYSIECLALAVGLAALAIMANGGWRHVYAHLFGAALMYSLSSAVINRAIDRGAYHTGSLYDLPLLGSFLWFAVAAVVGRRVNLESNPQAHTPGQQLSSRIAMATLLSMPPMAFWAVWASTAQLSVRMFRLGVTQIGILAGIGLITLRRRMVDQDRQRLVRSLQDTVDNLQRLQSRLVQSEKLASLGHLAAGAAHEINNPLTGILGYVEMLLNDLSLTDKARATSEKIRDQGLRIKKLVTSLLSFSRQVPADKVPLDLVQVVNSALQLGNLGAHRKNIRIEVKADSMLPTVRGDSDQLLRVFFNLIDNASDAMQEVGGGLLQIRVFSERGKVIAEFTDTGPGIREPRRVFDPFYTTKPAGKGTGLGLSLCYGIIQEHGGDLTCRNTPGAGATFRVELPAPITLAGASSTPMESLRVR
ncbi:MAG TPA: ATP-binding protein [Candidatus Acidoferrales bacterium]|nr:ATP-binding protein [Candidatus Acidoferrales bacterium]